MTTTLSIDDDTLETFKEYSHGDHETRGETLEALMDIVPTPGDIHESGCNNPNCPEEYFVGDDPINEVGGIIQFFAWEPPESDRTITHSAWFCSASCALEAKEETQKYVPENPDLVVVGGVDEMPAEFEGATFYLDRDIMEVGIPVPGAFDGSDSHGNEYDYVGEPVYIQEQGEWVQNGIIEDIIHEESHTTLLLDSTGDYEKVMFNHPDEQRREQYREKHEKRSQEECANCGATLFFATQDPPEECPECGETDW